MRSGEGSKRSLERLESLVYSTVALRCFRVSHILQELLKVSSAGRPLHSMGSTWDGTAASKNSCRSLKRTFWGEDLGAVSQQSGFGVIMGHMQEVREGFCRKVMAAASDCAQAKRLYGTGLTRALAGRHY